MKERQAEREQAMTMNLSDAAKDLYEKKYTFPKSKVAQRCLLIFYYSTVGCSIATCGLFFLNDTIGKITIRQLRNFVYIIACSPIFLQFLPENQIGENKKGKSK